MKKTYLLILCLLFCTMSAMAQTRTVSGVIKDSNGEPIIGATVFELSTNNGTTTGVDGDFLLELESESPKLEISYIGYVTQVIEVGAQTKFDIVMLNDDHTLEDVVVTGYGGRQLRSKVTNSIATVDDELLTKGFYNNPAQALSGAVPGVRVIQSSGSPTATPTIILRGGTNFDGTGSPLIIVDGQIRGSLNDINNEDIGSMEVLKDAGATALYGARASNGVILITTKSGKAGTRSIKASAKVGISWVNNPYEFLNAEQYITAMRTAYVNTPWAPVANLNGATPMGIGNSIDNPNMAWNLMEMTPANEYLLQKGWQSMIDPIDDTRTLIFKDTNPADYNLVNPAISQNYNLSMSGGNDKGTYYASLGYLDAEGLPIDSFNERLTFVLNGSYKVADFITSDSRLNFTRSNWQDMPATQTSVANYFGRIMSMPPTARYEDEDGNALLGSNSGDGNQSYQSSQFYRMNTVNKLILTQDFTIDILKELSVKISGTWNYDDTLTEAFNKDYQTSPGIYNRTRSSSASFDRTFRQTYNAVLNYNKTFNDAHNVSLLAGTEFYDNYSYGLDASGSGAATDDFSDLSYTSSEEGKRSINTDHVRFRILSFFGRLNYDYKDKYLLSAVVRRDGYSALLNNRWGTFPGLSAGWIFGREDFVQDNFDFLSFGKLRVSYGQNGNASGIGAYQLQGAYSSATYDGNVGFLIGTLPNPNLKWESTRTMEVGTDLGFFENRLNVNITYYDRLTSDKYANLSLPSTTGFSSVLSNNGKFRNRGLELDMSGTVLKKGDWNWDASFNISYNKNKVIELPDNGLLNNRQGGVEIYTGNGTETMFVGGYQEGQEPGLLVTYQATGIYNSVDDIPADLVVKSGNHQGKWQYGPAAWAALTDAQRASGIELQPGDVQWHDVNGDGVIDQFDQVVVGNTTPRWTGGFNTTVSWKRLSLFARVDFALDYSIYDYNTPWILGAAQGTYNTTTDYFDTWTPDNPNAKYPRYVYADFLGAGNYGGTGARTSSMFAFSGNYLSIREIALSYSLPTDIAKSIRMQAVDISISAQNLGYITEAKTISSPEVSSAGWGYALPRTLVLSANITF